MVTFGHSHDLVGELQVADRRIVLFTLGLSNREREVRSGLFRQPGETSDGGPVFLHLFSGSRIVVLLLRMNAHLVDPVLGIGHL